jgi:hypothetical protein
MFYLDFLKMIFKIKLFYLIMEDNPWLDTTEIKHANKKSIKVKKENYKKVEKVEKKEVEKVEKKDVEKVEEKKKEVVKENEIDILSIKKDERRSSFLKTLVDELDHLPKKSIDFAIENFGEEWLKDFMIDVQNVKSDIINSKFFPSQDRLILLKFILLLQQ